MYTYVNPYNNRNMKYVTLDGVKRWDFEKTINIPLRHRTAYLDVLQLLLSILYINKEKSILYYYKCYILYPRWMYLTAYQERKYIYIHTHSFWLIFCSVMLWISILMMHSDTDVLMHVFLFLTLHLPLLITCI